MSKQYKIDQTLILDMANELIKRHGNRAIDIAKERVQKAKGGKFPSDKDIALLILTQIEEIICGAYQG